MPSQSFFVFAEIRMAHVNGEFIATILLATALVEHWLSIAVASRGFAKVTKRGLAAMEDCAREHDLLHPYLLDKLSALRSIRNPFAHLKHSVEPKELVTRAQFQRRDVEEVLQEDARKAMELAFAIVSGKGRLAR